MTKAALTLACVAVALSAVASATKLPFRRAHLEHEHEPEHEGFEHEPHHLEHHARLGHFEEPFEHGEMEHRHAGFGHHQHEWVAGEQSEGHPEPMRHPIRRPFLKSFKLPKNAKLSVTTGGSGGGAQESQAAGGGAGGNSGASEKSARLSGSHESHATGAEKSHRHGNSAAAAASGAHEHESHAAGEKGHRHGAGHAEGHAAGADKHARLTNRKTTENKKGFLAGEKKGFEADLQHHENHEDLGVHKQSHNRHKFNRLDGLRHTDSESDSLHLGAGEFKFLGGGVSSKITNEKELDLHTRPHHRRGPHHAHHAHHAHHHSSEESSEGPAILIEN